MKLSYEERKQKRAMRKLMRCYPLWSETKKTSARATNGVSTLPERKTVKRWGNK